MDKKRFSRERIFGEILFCVFVCFAMSVSASASASVNADSANADSVNAALLGVSVKASVNVSQVFIGDFFKYEIEVETAREAKVELPEFVGNLSGFEVRDLKTEEVHLKESGTISGERKKTIWKATLNTFVSGDFLLLPQVVWVISGKDTVQMMTDPVPIRVSARTTDSDVDILDAEAPLAPPGTPWYVWMGIGFSAAVLGFLLYLAFKFGKRAARVNILPPYEEAQLALAALTAKNWAESDQPAFFTELGFIARRYAERRFETDVLDATVSELKSRLAPVVGLPEAFKMGLVTFAEESEPVKFAKMQLPNERSVYWLDFVTRFVEQTKPVPEKEKGK